jgi:hypothetical protein
MAMHKINKLNGYQVKVIIYAYLLWLSYCGHIYALSDNPQTKFAN